MPLVAIPTKYIGLSLACILVCMCTLLLYTEMDSSLQSTASKFHAETRQYLQNIKSLHQPNKRKISMVHRNVLSIENKMQCSPCEHNLPSALIIGVKKGGTGSLLKYLGLHPDIAIPERQEVR